MDCSPAALACISAVWITLTAWAVYSLLLAASPVAPCNTTLDLLVVLAAATSRLLLVTCRPSLPTDAHARAAAAGRCRPRLAGYRGASARATDAAADDNQVVRSHEHGDAAASSTAVRCVVCLGEVGNGEPVKRLPACRHLFHQHCINLWLHGHPTCPVCRCSAFAPPPGPDGSG
ncbi:E3 ubiquitin-protein ligase EL5-like [Setaria italica]|uniref:E3 ubiquitin-protein ligase EL5-like n=1 Tax=Setaria italica TaxID=4555 RepID=UPI000350B61D|nr:E3 ubiquitin-protein ligase EL5-like [Setaria italica]